MTPYYAESVVCQIQFPSVRAMLEKNSLCPATVYKAGRIVPLIELYDAAAGAGRLPLLGDGDAVVALAIPPREVLDPEMYDPSKVMRSVQYVLDQGVIRVWNDDVLGFGSKTASLPAPGALATGTEAGDAAEVVRCWWAERLAPAGIGVMRYMGHDRPVALSCSRCGTTWETTSEEMARKTPKCPTCSGAKKPAKAKKLPPKERRAAKAEAFAAKVLERSCGGAGGRRRELLRLDGQGSRHLLRVRPPLVDEKRPLAVEALVPEVRRRQVIRRSPTYPRTSKEMSPCSSVSTLSTIRRSVSIFSDVEHPGLYQMPPPISKP